MKLARSILQVKMSNEKWNALGKVLIRLYTIKVFEVERKDKY